MMKATLLVLTLLVACVYSYTETEYQAAFTQWMQNKQKSYTSAEFLSRYNVFKSNMDYVQKWNANNKDTVCEYFTS